jgi:hypothetical protein
MEDLCIETKNRIFATFCFNTQVFSGLGKHFFALKMSNSDPLHVFTPRGVIFRKNFHVGGYCVIAQEFLLADFCF